VLGLKDEICWVLFYCEINSGVHNASMKPLVALFLLLALLFPAGIEVRGADTKDSDVDDELGSMVPLLLILATPEKYENHKVTFSAFVKRFEWGYVGFYNEDSAEYDLLEYGVLLQTNSATPVTNFNAIIEKNGTNECYSLCGVLQAERKERKLDKGRVLMPVIQLIDFRHYARGKRLSVIPNSAVEGTLIPAVSLLLQPEKLKQKKIVTRGILQGDPEGNLLFHATADSQCLFADYHFLFAHGESRFLSDELRAIVNMEPVKVLIYKASSQQPITVDGTIQEPHFSYPFPTVPAIEVVRYWQ